MTHYVIPSEKDLAAAQINGDIHIHDKDFLCMLTETCCQIDLGEAVPRRLLHRSRIYRVSQMIHPQPTLPWHALPFRQTRTRCTADRAVPNFDYAMAEGVAMNVPQMLYYDAVGSEHCRLGIWL